MHSWQVICITSWHVSKSTQKYSAETFVDMIFEKVTAQVMMNYTCCSSGKLNRALGIVPVRRSVCPIRAQTLVNSVLNP
jgi:hypothetical protein